MRNAVPVSGCLFNSVEFLRVSECYAPAAGFTFHRGLMQGHAKADANLFEVLNVPRGSALSREM